MIDRIISALLLVGACALAVFLFQRHYAAPSCRDDSVTALATSQISTDLGRTGFNITNIKETSGGLFSRVRHCQMDVAPIVDLQTMGSAHWMSVIYSDAREGKSNAVTVDARVVGPTEAHFAASNG
ncbi:hypothetical protein ACELLULO517_10420 [Acidisoma cellulosilytica]|uniref:Uncharacterized protein n=1 Tax=Acidisoma cellulosilyticum TaxID=2802395 RepID=A0A963Z2A5_9PROT|nr:hypothetical protein [Acidisoma cellulosilyticum]MCB8880647.1 hypothetical protein [Acidisoma cellulosilyticum]